MEYRRLGASGLKVPALSFGAGTFGGSGPLFGAWGTTDAAEARRLVDICLEAGVNLFDTADVYSNGASEEVLGEAIKGRRDAGADLDQDQPADGRRAERCRLLALAPDPRGRGRAAPPRHRLHRPPAAARLRRRHAGRGGAGDARRPRARRQAPLCRRLQLLRLAADEVAGGRRQATAIRATSPIRSTIRWSAATTSGS